MSFPLNETTVVEVQLCLAKDLDLTLSAGRQGSHKISEGQRRRQGQVSSILSGPSNYPRPDS